MKSVAQHFRIIIIFELQSVQLGQSGACHEDARSVSLETKCAGFSFP